VDVVTLDCELNMDGSLKSTGNQLPQAETRSQRGTMHNLCMAMLRGLDRYVACTPGSRSGISSERKKKLNYISNPTAAGRRVHMPAPGHHSVPDILAAPLNFRRSR